MSCWLVTQSSCCCLVAETGQTSESSDSKSDIRKTDKRTLETSLKPSASFARCTKGFQWPSTGHPAGADQKMNGKSGRHIHPRRGATYRHDDNQYQARIMTVQRNHSYQDSQRHVAFRSDRLLLDGSDSSSRHHSINHDPQNIAQPTSFWSAADAQGRSYIQSNTR